MYKFIITLIHNNYNYNKREFRKKVKKNRISKIFYHFVILSLSLGTYKYWF